MFLKCQLKANYACQVFSTCQLEILFEKSRKIKVKFKLI